MCTVTYMPLEKGFVLTSNRDEDPRRAAEKIIQEERNGALITYPKDIGAGGTWIAASSTGQVVCLLNGAYEKHDRNPPYKRSRGLMVLSFFDYEGVNDFVSQYDFDGMEPFTFLMMEQETLWELRWLGTEMTLKKLDKKGRYIWSSSTLYDAEMRAKRGHWFNMWEAEGNWTAKGILEFHLLGGVGDPEIDIVMCRKSGAQSVSITQIKIGEDMCMNHLNLLDGTTNMKSLKVNNEKVCG